MVRFQKLTKNLFLTLHGHNVHRQQRHLSKFLMRYQQLASHAYCAKLLDTILCLSGGRTLMRSPAVTILSALCSSYTVLCTTNTNTCVFSMVYFKTLSVHQVTALINCTYLTAGYLNILF